jgi:hypothetical protein
MLCNVAREALSLNADRETGKKLEKLFNACLGLNSEARVVIAHGAWFGDGAGARHLNRRSLRTSPKFENFKDIQKWTAEAQRLMGKVITETGWKYVRESDGLAFEVGKWP